MTTEHLVDPSHLHGDELREFLCLFGRLQVLRTQDFLAGKSMYCGRRDVVVVKRLKEAGLGKLSVISGEGYGWFTLYPWAAEHPVILEQLWGLPGAEPGGDVVMVKSLFGDLFE